MLSLWMLSGLSARFVTGANGADAAGTAAFGISFTMDTALFSENESLFPGVKNDEGSILTLSGKAEVSVKTSVSVENVAELCVPKGYYHIDYGENTVTYVAEGEHTDDGDPSYTEDDHDDYRYCLQVEKDYYPLQYTVSIPDTTANSGWTAVNGATDLTIDQLIEWFKTNCAKEYSSNTELDEKWKITWKWPMNKKDPNKIKDEKDTLLLANAKIDETTGEKSPLLRWIDKDGNDAERPTGFSDSEKMKLVLKIEQVD
jgi:hypothetical protein